MTDYGTAKERVARGAAFLAERFPDWREYVDSDSLVMTSARLCVLGQLGYKHPEFSGGFWAALHDLEKSKSWAMENGFLTPCALGGYECVCEEEGEELRLEWVRILEEEK